MRKQAGMTIVEILVAFSIMAVGMLAITYVYLSIKKQTTVVSQNWSKLLNVRNIAVNISSNIANYQINFDQSSGTVPCQFLSNSGGMPLAWDGTNIMDRESCTGVCPEGKAGFVIQPFPNKAVRGAYLVTLRMMHPIYTKDQVSSICGIQDAEEYQFVVGLK